MNYEVPANFDSVEGALEFIKSEIQANVDKNNEMVLSGEKYAKKLELLEVQVADMTTQATELTERLTNLELKREAVKKELRDHSDKVTSRLEKERADFEAVRAKERERLETQEKALVERAEALEQREVAIMTADGDLSTRERELSDNIGQIAINEQALAHRESGLNLRDAELSKKGIDLNHRESAVDTREATLKVRSDEVDEKQHQVESIVIISEGRVAKIETIQKQLDDRETRLNIKEAGLIELDKTLTAKKIHLDDKIATQATH